MSRVSWKVARSRLGLLLAGGAFLSIGRSNAEGAHRVPAPAVDEPAGDARTATAVLAGGCFWVIGRVFQHVSGVTRAVSGYAGGAMKHGTLRAGGIGRDRPRRVLCKIS